MSSTIASALDRIGIGLSVLCVFHCLALPLLLTGAAVWWTGEAVHTGLALVLVPLALVAGLRGAARHHRRSVIFLLLAGAALLLVAILFEERLGSSGHVGLTATGGLILVAGHLANWRLSKHRSVAVRDA